MRITELRPMFWTENLKESIDFYTDVLGFECCEVNEGWGWASLKLDDVAVMFARPFDSVTYEKLGFTGSVYFNTDEVDAMWQKVKDKANICYGIEEFAWECANLPFMTTTATCCSLDRRSRRNK